MSFEEIEDFVEKSTILQQTISGIADGTINEEVDLRQYGILTLEQQQEEEERKASRANEELKRKQSQKKQREREQERKQWWEGAECLFGPRMDQDQNQPICDVIIEVRVVSTLTTILALVCTVILKSEIIAYHSSLYFNRRKITTEFMSMTMLSVNATVPIILDGQTKLTSQMMKQPKRRNSIKKSYWIKRRTKNLKK